MTDKQIPQLTEKTTLDADDKFIISDASDTSEAKYITRTNALTDISADRIKGKPVGDISAITNGELLAWDGVEFVAQTPGAPGAHATTHQDNGTDIIDISKIRWDGWQEYTTIMPTSVSTIGGVDTIVFANEDLTGITQKGDWVRISSTAGSDLIYKVKSVAFSTNTTMEVIGETSVSGTITSVDFSKEHSPQGALDWRMQFIAKGRMTTVQTIPQAVFTTLTFPTEEFDPNGDFSASTGVYTVPVTGVYRFDGLCLMYDSADKIGYSILGLIINGGRIESDKLYVSPGASTSQYHTPKLSTIKHLIRGDLVRFDAYVTTSDAGSIETGRNGLDPNFMNIEFIGI